MRSGLAKTHRYDDEISIKMFDMRDGTHEVIVILLDKEYSVVCPNERIACRKYKMFERILDAIFEGEEEICDCKISKAQRIMLVVCDEFGG